MTTPPNRQSRRQAAAKARRGKKIKPLSPAALEAQAVHTFSLTHLTGITQTAQPLSSDQAAELGRHIVELGSVIAALPDGSPEHRRRVAERVALMNFFHNGVRYDHTVERHARYLMADEPAPTRLAEPNDANPDPERRWHSAETRYYEQTFLARGLADACASVLGPTRAAAFATELLAARNGEPFRMLLPAQTRAGTSDSLHREFLKGMAVRRWAFDAVVEGVPRTVILARANGQGGGRLIEPDTIEHWRRGPAKQHLALDEEIARQVREGTEASLPPALQIRLLQLTRRTFEEWLQLALQRD